MIQENTIVVLKTRRKNKGIVTGVSKKDNITTVAVTWDDLGIPPSEHKISELREIGTLHKSM